jgi:hypothetical protein
MLGKGLAYPRKFCFQWDKILNKQTYDIIQARLENLVAPEVSDDDFDLISRVCYAKGNKNNRAIKGSISDCTSAEVVDYWMKAHDPLRDMLVQGNVLQPHLRVTDAAILDPIDWDFVPEARITATAPLYQTLSSRKGEDL